LSQWDRQAACTKPVPQGLGKVKSDLSLSHGTSLVIYPRWSPFLVPGQVLYPRWILPQFHLSQLVPQSGSTRLCEIPNSENNSSTFFSNLRYIFPDSYWCGLNKIVGVCVPLRSYGKGTGIVISITQTQLWEREGNQPGDFFFENR